MTVEERVDSVCKWNNPGLRALVIQLLRDQIEACAKIVDQEENELIITADKIKQQSGLKSVNQAAATQLLFAAMLHKQTGEKIRALAESEEEKEKGE